MFEQYIHAIANSWSEKFAGAKSVQDSTYIGFNFSSLSLASSFGK